MEFKCNFYVDDTNLETCQCFSVRLLIEHSEHIAHIEHTELGIY